MEAKIYHGDCLEIMRTFPDKHFDLVFCSPPYEAARTYGIDFKLRGQAWVDWCLPRYFECLRVCRGLVAWVIEGQTRNFRYSATPALLMADLHRAGVNLRKPPIFKRVGIPGSGGPDWLRNDYETIVCATQAGKLPWSDNTAMGHTPKWAPGGKMSNRHADGQRINAQSSKRDKFGFTPGVEPSQSQRANGARRSYIREKANEPKAVAFLNGELQGSKLHTKSNGKEMRVQCYTPPVKANPGNVIQCVVGGGSMGSKLCHENEAPFPESLAEFFIRSFCPPGRTVLDPFCGSGTTIAVAKRLDREAVGIDIRESQVELSSRRVCQD